ncbi:hypothetical protein L211DRAFT_211566 [Terfezia boudieri ATCC MYA-4762]|uniref:Uncharacterized protein n=1 Tax=Terfezia boudieri ATCC MYA-4762 TaxID=1051890 RepID=A0A3N4LRJ3_9PEZI|nr:hypothetical protein L211DRAFT_211566 [Terfezia boudieri ATCC MYA-4762]
MLRRAYDRHYYQGKIPHMKLIYPFVNYPFDTSTSLTNTTIPISARLHHAISQHPPFPIHLTTLQRLGRAPCSTSLTNGRTLPLLSFHPSPASLPNLYSLQSSLRTAFSPEIDKVVAAGGDMSTGVLHLNSPPLLATGFERGEREVQEGLMGQERGQGREYVGGCEVWGQVGWEGEGDGGMGGDGGGGRG